MAFQRRSAYPAEPKPDYEEENVYDEIDDRASCHRSRGQPPRPPRPAPPLPPRPPQKQSAGFEVPSVPGQRQKVLPPPPPPRPPQKQNAGFEVPSVPGQRQRVLPPPPPPRPPKLSLRGDDEVSTEQRAAGPPSSPSAASPGSDSINSSWSTVWPDEVYEQERQERSDLSLPSSPDLFVPPANVVGGSDPYVRSKRVFALSDCSFREFIKKQDVALVMFYDQNMKCNGKVEKRTKKHFIQAAEETVRPNTSFATVDCDKDVCLCEKEEIPSFPYYRLYSKGRTVSSISDVVTFDKDLMLKFVEKSPVFSRP